MEIWQNEATLPNSSCSAMHLILGCWKKAKAEATQSLHDARLKLWEHDSGQSLNVAAAFAADMPKYFLLAFHDYLKSGLSTAQQPTWNFGHIVECLQCEFKQCLCSASARELKTFGVSENECEMF